MSKTGASVYKIGKQEVTWFSLVILLNKLILTSSHTKYITDFSLLNEQKLTNIKKC